MNDGLIKGFLVQFRYVNWLPASREPRGES